MGVLHRPLWTYGSDSGLKRDLPHNPPDVCVVGAGVSGLSVAVCLAREGARVLVLDRVGVGAGETRRSSAHLSWVLDDRYFHLEKWHGKAGARDACESHRSAVDWIEKLVLEEAIDCGFERLPGYLVGAADSDGSILERERDAARRAGVDARWCRSGVPGFVGPGPALEFARQAQLDPARYVAGLAAYARTLGVVLCGPAEVVDVRDGSPVQVTLRDGTRIECGNAVLASNVPFHSRFAMHTKQAPYRTHAIAVPIPLQHAPPGLLWDTADPYHYVRKVHSNAPGDRHPRLIVGGADIKTGQFLEHDPYRSLVDWVRQCFPAAGEVTHAWSGQVLEPADGLGYAGLAPGHEHVYVVTGDSGNGMTHGTLAGGLIADLVQGRDTPWAELYSPSRKAFSGAGRWLRENANVAAQYGDWIRPAHAVEASSQANTSPARLWRDGVHLLASYRDFNGDEHTFSARCPHLGCAVHWNPAESTWDCPCHGSRFHPIDGRVLNGPAVEPLSPYPASKEDR